MIGLCIASAGLSAFVPISEFTLGWMHSIERVRWEEDWRIHSTDQGLQLHLHGARILGSAAGMEPPDGAILIDGAWHYSLDLQLPELVLTHSRFTSGYDLCHNGRCQALIASLSGLETLPLNASVIRLRACDESHKPAVLERAIPHPF